MKHRTFRNRIAAGAAITMATLAGAMMMTTGAASAGVPGVPPDPTFGVAPNYYNGNVGQIIRSAGSDTTYYLQQSISDLFNGAGLYGCGGSTGPANGFPCQSGHNTSTTDVSDNWDRTEYIPGVDDIGSGAGQNQICDNANATPQPIDMARSSKPLSNPPACPQIAGIQEAYAYDGVVELDWTGVNPSTYGPLTNTTTPWYGAVHTMANESAQNGTDGCTFTSFPSPSCDLMGPVSAGWIPGNNVNGPYTGTAFNDLDNNDNGGSAGSTAYRLYCATGGTQITDWGTITNGVAPGLASNASISIPVNVMGVNPKSGTVATMATFMNSSVVASSECNSGAKDTNQNDMTFVGTATPEVAVENNAAQVGDFERSDYPNDAVDQAAELSTTLYYMSEGPLAANPFERQVTIYNNGGTTGPSTSYGGNKMTLNTIGASSLTEENIGGLFPTARALFQFALGYQTPGDDQNTPQPITVTDDSFGSGSNTISSPSANFQQSDIGLTVFGAGIPTGTYITAVSGPTNSQADLVNGTALPANTVELSQPTTAANTAMESLTFGNRGHVVGIRASTIGFLNYMCSTNTGLHPDGVLTKGTDLQTGFNFDTELSNTINNTYGFNRIADTYTGYWVSSKGDTCGLIYPTWSSHATPNDGGSALTNPYIAANFPSISTSPAPATDPLPTVSSGTYSGLAGAITFPDS